SSKTGSAISIRRLAIRPVYPNPSPPRNHPLPLPLPFPISSLSLSLSPQLPTLLPLRRCDHESTVLTHPLARPARRPIAPRRHRGRRPLYRGVHVRDQCRDAS